MADITNFFTPESKNAKGGVNMLAWHDENRKAFYLTNVYHEKLLKLLVRNEACNNTSTVHAQIKIIGYEVKRARIWEDKPSDPRIERFPSVVEMTYHGAKKENQDSKIHLKAKSRYKTLIDDSLLLPADIDVPVPLFALETGYANNKKTGNIVRKSGHKISTDHPGFVRVDFYLASLKMDLNAFVGSWYFFNLFWTQDYLAAAKNNMLNSGLIIAPILFLPMGEYLLVVRRSLSSHSGRPFLSFYRNKDYRNKLMLRPVAYRGQDGCLQWSTMEEEEERLQRGKYDR